MADHREDGRPGLYRSQKITRQANHGKATGAGVLRAWTPSPLVPAVAVAAPVSPFAPMAVIPAALVTMTFIPAAFATMTPVSATLIPSFLRRR